MLSRPPDRSRGDCGDTADNLVFKAAQLLGERVPGLKLGEFTLDKVLPVAAGIGGGSADAAAALRLLARANGLAIDDPRLIEVAKLTGADVPVCLASRACDMTGVGETLMPLSLPIIPCVLVNPRVPVATKDVFAALGLRNGELLVGFADVLQATAWPEEGASIEDWVEVLAANSNDLEAPAMRIQPLNLMKQRAVRLAHHLGQHVQPAAMRHAQNDFLYAEIATALDDLLKRRDQRFSAVEAEALGAGELEVAELLKPFGLDQLVEDRARWPSRVKLISLSGPSMRSWIQAFCAALVMCMN